MSIATFLPEGEKSWRTSVAADYLALKPKTLEKMAREERIPARFYGGHWFFLKSELDGWRQSLLRSTSPSVPLTRRKDV